MTNLIEKNAHVYVLDKKVAKKHYLPLKKAITCNVEIGPDDEGVAKNIKCDNQDIKDFPVKHSKGFWIIYS